MDNMADCFLNMKRDYQHHYSGTVLNNNCAHVFILSLTLIKFIELKKIPKIITSLHYQEAKQK